MKSVVATNHPRTRHALIRRYRRLGFDAGAGLPARGLMWVAMAVPLRRSRLGSLGFGGEESAGTSFLRRDGSVWTTDKDGLVPALLTAEITALRSRPGPALRRARTPDGNQAASKKDH